MVSREYDVLIIGSGMGGLCAGALLSSRGWKTLIVERLPRVGGRCSTLSYKGFRCITGVLGVELGGVVESLFREVDARFHVIPAGEPHYLIGGEIVAVPPKGGLRRLLEAASADRVGIAKILDGFATAAASPASIQPTSLGNWVRQFTHDERIMELFHAMVAPTLMVTPDEISAREYFIFVNRLKGIRKWGYCPEGSISLARALLKVIRKNNGDLWKGTSVRQISSRKKVATGAVLSKNGREVSVKASIVISNVGPRNTVRLAGEHHFGEDYLKSVREHLRPAAVLAIQAASDEPLMELDYLLVTGTRRMHSMYQPTNRCPHLAPNGKHLLIAAGSPVSSTGPFQPKEELRHCLMDLRDLIPDFEKRARVLLAGCYQGDWPGMHAWPGRDLPNRTPIENLYNVGDGVKPPGMTALPGVVASAIYVVQDILKS